jgi:thiol-disulfide isomerase/thioredoxin
MKRKIAFAGLLLVAGMTLAVAQTSPPPKDPPMIDLRGYHKILEQHKGQPLVVNFWATWCEPCRDEYPMLNELARQYSPQGLKVVGVSLDQDGDLLLMRRFLTRNKPVFPNYRKIKGDEAAFTNAVLPGWNGALPATFFYAKDGSQVAHVLGAGDHDSFEATIRSILAK